MAQIHENLKKLRKESNMTLKEVAKKLGTTESTVQRYETGRGIKFVPYDKIVEYARIFCVEPSEIMGWNESQLDKSFSIVRAKWNHLSEKDKQYIIDTIDYLIDRGNR